MLSTIKINQPQRSRTQVRLLFLASTAALCLAGTITSGARAQEKAPYLDASKPLEARVDDLLARMTVDEKISLLHGDSKFTTNAIPRLGIPRRWMSDGPMGVREDVGPDTWDPAGHTDDFVTYMPCPLELAATWNPELGHLYGTVIGEEARIRGKDIMLGPGVNIMRTPLNGRNWEYMGEDPFLASRMAVGYIQGVQAQGVSSCVKHFALNNQETQRNSINVEVDERALHEIYLPAFKAATREGGVWAVMGAYNKFRGQYCAENDYLLNTVLKGQWGFKGLVMSDWAGAHDTPGAARGGLDLEMGSNGPYDDFYLAKPFRDGVQKGDYPMALLDDKVRRNLRVMIATGALNPETRPAGKLNTPAHQAAARQIAEEGIVLLKNSGNALPLDLAKIHSIAVIGEDASTKQAHGGQSAAIKAFYEVTPLDGILHRAGDRVDITFSQGYKQAAPPRRRQASYDAAGVQITDPASTAAQESAALIDRAAKAAAQADVAVVFVGLNHNRNGDTEGSDRRDIKLPAGQDALVARVVAANPRTIVVIVSGGPVELGPWLSKVPALMENWYSGMEGGNAIAAALFGDVNPSGKLPCTFPKQLADSPAHAGADPKHYPGQEGVVHYDEGLLVGYRWFDTKGIEPLFPFGFGLSYTSFVYSNLKIVGGVGPTDPVATVQVDITNSGARDGSEVVQLYVHPEKPGLPRPTQELKGFQKVSLKAGETKTVTITLNAGAFSYYDPSKKGWVAETGSYTILAGSSSRDIRLKDDFKLSQPRFTAE